jgi:hypothetical protein
MAIDPIIAQIDAEIARLTKVRSLLADVGEGTATLTATFGMNSHSVKKRKKHFLSPEARKRIADAQRKRWAAQKAKAKIK